MDTAMPTLTAYRQAPYHCFTRARDALFELGDARAPQTYARSFVDVAQAPCLQRRGPSL